MVRPSYGKPHTGRQQNGCREPTNPHSSIVLASSLECQTRERT
jgi:hypothetical protein